MNKRILIWAVVAWIPLFFVSTGWAEVPAPPVNQDIGMPDITLGDLAEADCRVCHSSGLPDRHHNLYGNSVPSGSLVPYPDADGDGTADPVYACLNCHNENFTVERECTVCHGGDSPHHSTAEATNRNCTACHGDLVDNFDDGHYIPSYAPSLVTPDRGDCSNCHDEGTDTGSGYAVLGNQDLHHNTGLGTCSWCHDFGLPQEAQVRVCEECHGADSLHNIQVDSPNVNNVGTVVVGGEDAGYGHVGRDAGPGDSDCWGCHGFSGADLTLISGAVAPTVYDARPAIVKTGTNTLVTLTGAALTNTTGSVLFESDVVLTAADGSSVTLTPGIIYEGLLKVSIPGSTSPGNYRLRAVKTDDEGDLASSNAVALQIVPDVSIANVTASDGMVTIEGSGFAGYAEGSVTSVTGTITTGAEGTETTTTLGATIVSWSDTVIKVDFGAASPEAVTVSSVFGTDTYSN